MALYRLIGDEAHVVTGHSGVVYNLDPGHTYDSEDPADLDAIVECGERFMQEFSPPVERATAKPGEKRTTRR